MNKGSAVQPPIYSGAVRRRETIRRNSATGICLSYRRSCGAEGTGMAGRKRSVLVATGAHGELAEALRRLRDQRGMTLRQVAARSGYSLATLSMAESGRRFPSWEVLAAFVQSCGADPGEWRPLWLSAAQSEARAD